jgi:hypothetical protein
LFLLSLNAATIVPYPNLGEMGKASQHVVVAKAEQNVSIVVDGVTYYQTRFIVIDRIKGNIENQFHVQNLRRTYGEWERVISGDIEFELGKEYLMCLRKIKEGVYQTKMLSHGVFVKDIIDQEAILVPVNQGLLSGDHIRTDGIEVESFAIYKNENLIPHLSEVLNSDVVWQKDKVSTKHSILAYYDDNSKDGEPDHCYATSTAPYTRWTDFPTSLPVHFASEGDPSCSSAGQIVQNAISNLNNNYPGLFLTGSSSFSDFVPTCGNQSGIGDAVFDNTFTNFIFDTFGSSRNIAVIFDDPCDEISDLSNCSGTLAYGGLWSSGTHTFDNISWRTAGYGFVVVNNDIGTCNCSTGYELMLVHEITHALGFDHISTSVGMANMNPSCCNLISALDFDCAQYSYPSTTVATEITEFYATKENTGIRLNWKNYSEISMDYYVVERSHDGINYEEITKLDATNAQNQINTYQFLDASPLNGHNYYRLIPVELNGKYGETELAEASFFYSNELLFYPNPTNGDLAQLRFLTEKASILEIDMLDITGKTIFRMQKNVEAGINWLTMELGDIKNGVYFMQISNDETHDLIRVIKSD